MLYYISLFTNIRCSLTYLPTYLKVWRHMWMLPNHTYARNRLTNFECKANGNGNNVNLLNFTWKNLWNHIKWAYFWRVLGHLEPQWREPLYSRTVCTVICTVQCTPYCGCPVVHWQCTELLPILCTVRTSARPSDVRIVGPNFKNPLKIRWKKSWNWRTCNNLTNFEWKSKSPGNGNRCKFAEIRLEKLVKWHQWNLFCGGF